MLVRIAITIRIIIMANGRAHLPILIQELMKVLTTLLITLVNTIHHTLITDMVTVHQRIMFIGVQIQVVIDTTPHITTTMNHIIGHTDIPRRIIIHTTEIFVE